jgi:RNA ligase
MHESLKQYEDLVELGILKRSRQNGLVLYGYTDKCTFDRHWTDVTRNARGIVFDEETGFKVAHPFPKFFNLGEMPETTFTALPDEPYTIWEKVDGSLGIIYYWSGKWNIATRGSLNSEQAIRGAQILKKYNLESVNVGLTLMAEIIYPENRIIADYGNDEKLVLLGANWVDTGNAASNALLEGIAWETGMPLTKKYDMDIGQAIELSKTLPKLEEGFVVQYRSGLRVKIKGVEYMKIAKIINHLSPLSLWEAMSNGRVNEEYLQQIPEEFRATWEPMVDELEASYHKIKRYTEIKLRECPVDITDNRALGIFMKEGNYFPYPTVVWPIVRQNAEATDNAIMKLIKPIGNVMVVI